MYYLSVVYVLIHIELYFYIYKRSYEYKAKVHRMHNDVAMYHYSVVRFTLHLLVTYHIRELSIKISYS